MNRDAYPASLEWESCRPEVAPGAGCRRVVGRSSFAVTAWVDATGHVHVAGTRRAEPPLEGWYWFIADVDGGLETVLYHERCSFDVTQLNAGRYTVRVIGDSDTTSGFFAGEIGETSPRLAVPTMNRKFDPIPGTFALFVESIDFGIERRSWADGASLGQFWSKAQDHGLDQGPFVHTHDAMFWNADNLDYAKVNVYTPADGIREFLTAGYVIDRGYSDLGTDGKDMAWIYAHDRTSGDLTPYDHYDVMAAAYTTEPANVVSRRLRSEEGPSLGLSPFVVGCGYAARSNGRHLRLVRLSDGRSWVFESSNVGFYAPLAITCDELVADLADETYYTLGRVRLDLLGPGIPPD